MLAPIQVGTSMASPYKSPEIWVRHFFGFLVYGIFFWPESWRGSLDFIYWTSLIFILIYFEWRDIENQQLGKTRKWKVREKLTEREKAPPLLSFLLFIFVFALSQFSGPDYQGAWNRPSKARTLRPYQTKNNSKLAWCTIKALPPSFRVTKRQTSK